MPPEAGGTAADGDTELMPAIRKVIAYSGLSYTEVLDLPTDIYLLMLKNAYVEDMMRTPEGQEHLATCKRLAQKEPDMEAIRKFNSHR